jgi:hypothetical protein
MWYHLTDYQLLKPSVCSQPTLSMCLQHFTSFQSTITQYLNWRYGNCWIGRRKPHAWPPHSPDLTPLDFYFQGYIKFVYKEILHTSDQFLYYFMAGAALATLATQTSQPQPPSFNCRCAGCGTPVPPPPPKKHCCVIF